MERIAITRYRSWTHPLMRQQMFEEETLQQRADQLGRLHCRSPRVADRSNVDKAVANNAGVAVRYQYVSSGLTCPRYTDKFGSHSRIGAPSWHHRVNRSTANVCLRLCSVGGRAPEDGAMPSWRVVRANQVAKKP